MLNTDLLVVDTRSLTEYFRPILIWVKNHTGGMEEY